MAGLHVSGPYPWQGRLQDEQRVSSLAWLLCVERKSLYRVFDGSEWRH